MLGIGEHGQLIFEGAIVPFDTAVGSGIGRSGSYILDLEDGVDVLEDVVVELLALV